MIVTMQIHRHKSSEVVCYSSLDDSPPCKNLKPFYSLLCVVWCALEGRTWDMTASGIFSFYMYALKTTHEIPTRHTYNTAYRTCTSKISV